MFSSAANRRMRAIRKKHGDEYLRRVKSQMFFERGSDSNKIFSNAEVKAAYKTLEAADVAVNDTDIASW